MFSYVLTISYNTVSTIPQFIEEIPSFLFVVRLWLFSGGEIQKLSFAKEWMDFCGGYSLLLIVPLSVLNLRNAKLV